MGSPERKLIGGSDLLVLKGSKHIQNTQCGRCALDEDPDPRCVWAICASMVQSGMLQMERSFCSLRPVRRAVLHALLFVELCGTCVYFSRNAFIKDNLHIFKSDTIGTAVFGFCVALAGILLQSVSAISSHCCKHEQVHRVRRRQLWSKGLQRATWIRNLILDASSEDLDGSFV